MPSVNEPQDRRAGRATPEYLTIGTITSPKGLAGEVRVYSHSDWPQRFAALSKVFLGEGGRPAGKARTVERAAVHGSVIVLKLAGTDTREEAEALRGRDLLVAAEDAWPLPEGHYYHYQLIGMKVLDTEGTDRGTLVRIYPGPANDFYAVAGPEGTETLIPGVRTAVRSIDPRTGTMVVEWPEFCGDEGATPAGGRKRDAD